MTTPGTVTLPSDAANLGKSVDNSVLTNNNTLVYRQIVSLGDPNTFSNRLSIDASGAASTKPGLQPISQLTPLVVNEEGLTAVLAPATTGLTNSLYRLIVVVDGTTTLTVMDGETALSGPIPCGAYGGLTLDFSGDPWYTSGEQDSALTLVSSNSVQISGTSYYAQH